MFVFVSQPFESMLSQLPQPAQGRGGARRKAAGLKALGMQPRSQADAHGFRHDGLGQAARGLG